MKNAHQAKIASSQVIVNDIVMNSKMPDVVTVRQVQVMRGYRVRMLFSNNTTRELDLKPYLNGPVFEPIRHDVKFFRRVFVDSETETLTWPNGADIDPETLFEDSKPTRLRIKQSLNDPTLRRQSKAHARHAIQSANHSRKPKTVTALTEL